MEMESSIIRWRWASLRCLRATETARLSILLDTPVPATATCLNLPLLLPLTSITTAKLTWRWQTGFGGDDRRRSFDISEHLPFHRPQSQHRLQQNERDCYLAVPI